MSYEEMVRRFKYDLAVRDAQIDLLLGAAEKAMVELEFAGAYSMKTLPGLVAAVRVVRVMKGDEAPGEFHND